MVYISIAVDSENFNGIKSMESNYEINLHEFIHTELVCK